MVIYHIDKAEYIEQKGKPCFQKDYTKECCPCSIFVCKGKCVRNVFITTGYRKEEEYLEARKKGKLKLNEAEK